MNVRAYPVGDKVNMLIRQVRSFGSLGKELVSMPRIQSAWKPKDSFRAPTYYIGGSNFALHGRVGFIMKRLVFMTFILLWRIIHKYTYMIKCRWKTLLKITCFSPPKSTLKS